MSSTSDITALVLAFPPRTEENKYILLPFFWLPEDTLELRCRRDHVLYDVWQKQGFIQTTEGNVIHYGFIEKFIERLGETYHIRKIAYDRWNATQMVQNLEDMGFAMVPFGQGFKDMSPPSKELFKLLMEGNILHGGNPVLKWMAGNVVMRQDPAGNIKPDKEKSVEKSTDSWRPSWHWTAASATGLAAAVSMTNEVLLYFDSCQPAAATWSFRSRACMSLMRVSSFGVVFSVSIRATEDWGEA